VLTGRTVFKPGTLAGILKRNANFTEARELVLTIPIGCWGQTRGELAKGGQMLTNLLDGLNSFGTALLEATGSDREAAQLLITEVARQYKHSSNLRLSMKIVYCAVQKVK